jgi:basic membrane protein A
LLGKGLVNKDLRRLTRRELQVAVFVAQGLSDREVAEKLSITRRTAEWHVEQILSKLALKSRSQIASGVSQAEALGGPLLAADRPRRSLPPNMSAVLGFNPAVSETHELLATTRSLADAPHESHSERRERLISLAESGYNPVIVTGAMYAFALREVAKQFPATKFAIVDDSSLSADNRNVTGLVFADHEGSYLVGAIAAQASRTGTIGFIGGVDLPSIRRFQVGYVAGAKVIKPDIEVRSDFLTQPPDFSGFADPAKGKAAAARMYENRADVVFHAAGGSGTGVFQAAKMAGAIAIGVDSDQYLTAPADVRPHVLTSMLKRVDEAVKEYVKASARASQLPRVMTFNLANGGVGYSKSNPELLPYIATTDDLLQQIVAGKIRVAT